MTDPETQATPAPARRATRLFGRLLAGITGGFGLVLGLSSLPNAIRYGFDPLVIAFAFVTPIVLGATSIVLILAGRFLEKATLPGRSTVVCLSVFGGASLGFLTYSDSSLFLCSSTGCFNVLTSMVPTLRHHVWVRPTEQLLGALLLFGLPIVLVLPRRAEPRGNAKVA